MIDSMKRPIAITIIVLVVLFSFGIRISHPHSGLKNALGSASSGIVVYKQTNQFSVGNKVMVRTADSASSPVLAIVRAVDNDKLEIQSGIATERIESKAAYGKLIVMIPFIGAFVNIFGF
jgi:hypothetical protein